MAKMSFKMTLPDGRDAHDLLVMEFTNIDEIADFVRFADKIKKFGWTVEVVEDDDGWWLHRKR